MASAVTAGPAAELPFGRDACHPAEARGPAALGDAGGAAARREPARGADRARIGSSPCWRPPAPARRPRSPPPSSWSSRPIAWLTLDTPDVAQGRLLTYLEASLARVAPQVARRRRPGARRRPRARRGRGPAGGRARRRSRVVLVLDDIERLGEAREPWELIDSLLRHGHSSLRAVLDQPPRHPARALGAAPVDGRDGRDRRRGPDLHGRRGRRRRWRRSARARRTRRAPSRPPAAGSPACCSRPGAPPSTCPAWAARPTRCTATCRRRCSPSCAAEDRDFLIETAVLHDVSPARAAALGRADAGRAARVAARRAPAGGVARRAG